VIQRRAKVIVVDTSVFLDELFNFDQKRHDKARILFRLIEEKDVLIVEPEIFRTKSGLIPSISMEGYSPYLSKGI